MYFSAAQPGGLADRLLDAFYNNIQKQIQCAGGVRHALKRIIRADRGDDDNLRL